MNKISDKCHVCEKHTAKIVIEKYISPKHEHNADGTLKN